MSTDPCQVCDFNLAHYRPKAAMSRAKRNQSCWSISLPSIHFWQCFNWWTCRPGSNTARHSFRQRNRSWQQPYQRKARQSQRCYSWSSAMPHSEHFLSETHSIGRSGLDTCEGYLQRTGKRPLQLPYRLPHPRAVAACMAHPANHARHPGSLVA